MVSGKCGTSRKLLGHPPRDGPASCRRAGRGRRSRARCPAARATRDLARRLGASARRRRRGCARASRPARLQPLDVAPDDPAVRAGALDAGEIDARAAAARRRASGEARMRSASAPPSRGGAVGGREARLAWRGFRGGGPLDRFGGRASPCGGGDAAAATGGGWPLRRRRGRARPRPFSRAIGALTFTPSVPSGTRSASTTPSSTASTSMVALSVSISAITSPDLHRVAHLHVPLGERALLHGGRQGRHQESVITGLLGLRCARSAGVAPPSRGRRTATTRDGESAASSRQRAFTDQPSGLERGR